MAPVAPTAPSPQPGPGSVADLLHQLGDVAPERVRMTPSPGTATLDDLIAANELKAGPVCEWVEGTLVEKPMGQRESWVTFIIMGELYAYSQSHDVGMFLGPDGVMKILPGIGRAPDVAFLAWGSLPGGKPPPRTDKVPAVVPDLAVEVLSESNRPGEMARKRDEYFRAGVKLVWEIDPETRSATMYTSPTAAQPVPADGTLDGGTVLPGFRLSLKTVFDRADHRA